MAVIRVYPPNERNFTDNGLKTIDARKALIHKENNGDYYINIKCHIKFAEYIIQDNIITVMTPWGLEGFRLDNPTVDGTTIECKAWQLFYDGENYVVPSATIQGLTGTNALSRVNEDASPVSPFVISGDVTDTVTTEYINNNLCSCMFDLASLCNGYLERNLFRINMKKSLGADRQQVIALGKNMTSYKQQEVWDNVVTQLMPIGYDGILLDDIYLYATDVCYDKPYCKAIEFSPSDGIDTSDTDAVKTDLLAQATTYLNQHKVPEVSYTLSANLDYVELGDTIHVKHPMVSVDLLTTVKSFEYDCITEKYQNITFGNAILNTKSKVQSALDKQTQNITHDVVNLGKSLEESKNTIKQFLYEGHRYETDNATYYLNASTPEQATKFMIISLGGIGFGTKQQGNSITGDESYNTAWTIDGNFNANFISTGTLEAILIKGCSIELSTNGNKNKLYLNPTTIKMQKVNADGTTTDIFYIDNDGNIRIISKDINILSDAINLESTKREELKITILGNTAIIGDNCTIGDNCLIGDDSSIISQVVKDTDARVTLLGDKLTSTISDNINNVNSKIEQTANSLTSTIENNKTDTSTQIEQLDNAINLRVTYKDIISAINLSPEAITIASGKINMTGYVTISDLSGGTTTISGNCITSGTITGVTVNAGGISMGNSIINLTAGSGAIKSGNFNVISVDSSNNVKVGTQNTSVTSTNIYGNTVSLTGNTYCNISAPSEVELSCGSSGRLTLDGSASLYGANSVSIQSANEIGLTALRIKIGTLTSNQIGFFGATPQTRKAAPTTLDGLITALKSYGLFG